MQPTAILSLLATMATVASAAPRAAQGSLSSRQGTPRVRAGFYGEGGCGNNGRDPNLEDMVFLQNTVTGRAGCQNLDVGPFPATYFNESSLTQTIRFYDIPCAQVPTNLQGGHFFDINPADNPTPGCKAQNIVSYLTCRNLNCVGET